MKFPPTTPELYGDDDDHYYHAREQLPAAKPNFRIWEMETLRCAVVHACKDAEKLTVTKYFHSKNSYSDLAS